MLLCSKIRQKISRVNFEIYSLKSTSNSGLINTFICLKKMWLILNDNKKGFTGNRTQIKGVKVPCASRYTIKPVK